LVDSYLLIRK